MLYLRFSLYAAYPYSIGYRWTIIIKHPSNFPYQSVKMKCETKKKNNKSQKKKKKTGELENYRTIVNKIVVLNNWYRYFVGLFFFFLVSCWFGLLVAGRIFNKFEWLMWRKSSFGAINSNDNKLNGNSFYSTFEFEWSRATKLKSYHHYFTLNDHASPLENDQQNNWLIKPDNLGWYIHT